MTTSLSKQFYAQTESLSELVRTGLKPYILSENLIEVNDVSRSILQIDNVAFIKVFSYNEPLLERQIGSYPERSFKLGRELLAANDGFYDVEYVFNIEGTQVGKVQISFSIEEERALLLEANRKLAVTAIVMTVIGLLITWFLAERMSRKIRMLERASNSIAAGEDEVDLPLEGDDEIAKTGQAFKNMLLQIKEKYEAINLSPDGIVLVSSNDHITYTNPALLTILGKQAQTLRGKSVTDFECLLINMLDKREHTNIKDLDTLLTLPEFRIHMPDFKILRCIRKRVENSAGQTFSEVFYLRDITHESEIDRMKSEFLTTAAHELRTPLASVMGFSELLITNDYPQEKIKFVAETINRQSQNLKHLVDDLLDIARIEARSNGVLNLEEGTARKLISECCDFIKGSDNRCQLIFDADASVWPRIMFDEYKLKQALINILSNAFKYSKPGGIVIVDTLILNAEHGDTNWFGIRVSDQGIGMSQEQLAHVGEKFYRADNTGSIPGTGLGMALTSEIVSLHNGHLDITSQLGQGTQVTLWIPLAEQYKEVMAHG
jgi:PAS domain S-box-containing protein